MVINIRPRALVVFSLFILVLSITFLTFFSPEPEILFTGYVSSTNLDKPSFSVNRDSIQVSFVQGDGVFKNLMIYNTGTGGVNISTNMTPSLDGILSFKKGSFVLPPQGSKLLKLNFSLGEADPGTYSGVIIITDGKTISPVDITVEVSEVLSSLEFGVRSDVSRVALGEILNMDIAISEGNNISGMSLNLYYGLRDSRGQTYSFREEMVSLEESLNIRRSLEVPENLVPGNYTVYSEISYGNGTKFSSYPIEIFDDSSFLLDNLLYILTGILLTFLIFWRFFKRRQEEKKIKRSIIQMEALASFDEDAEKDEDKKDGDSSDNKEGDRKEEKDGDSGGKKEGSEEGAPKE